MGFVESVRARIAEKRTIAGVPWQPWLDPYMRWDVGGPTHPSKSRYGVDEALGLPALYAGSKILSDNAASLPLRVYTQGGKSGPRLVPYNGPTMFDDPTVLGTPFDWIFACMSSLILQGNAWGLITGRDGFGFPKGIEWVPAERVYVEEDPDQPFNPMRTKVFVYGREMRWQGAMKEIYHIKAFGLPGRLDGISLLRNHALTITAGQEAQRFGTDWYKAGGFPPGTFQNSEAEVTPEQSEMIRSQLVKTLRRREPLVYGRNWDYCCDSATEMLTRRGWMKHDQIIEGDECLSLNPGTGLSEWQPVDHLYVFDGPHDVIEMSSSTHSSVTTASHRWPVVKRKTGKAAWTTTKEMSPDDRVTRAAPVQAPAEAKWSDSLVELVAWLWTEGHVRAGGMVEIEQSWKVNPRHVARIRAALTDLFGSSVESLRPYSYPKLPVPAWREDQHGNLTRFRLSSAAGKLLSSHAPGKVVSTSWLSELTRAQLELFIQVSVDADGWTRPSGSRRIAQRDKARVEAFQVACALAGYAGSVRENRHGMWVLEVGLRPYCSPAQPEYKTSYSFNGIVWCPTTKHANWFARRKGTTYFTGNTPVTCPPSEAQFIDAMRMTATHIAALLDLPPARLGGDQGSLTYSTVEQNQLQVIEALRPWLCRLEQSFSRLLPNNRVVRFNTDALLKTDLKTRAEIITAYRNIGLQTVDELRELIDLPPLPHDLGNETMPLQLMTSMAQRAGAFPKNMQDQVIFLMDRAGDKLQEMEKQGLTTASKFGGVDPKTGEKTGPAHNAGDFFANMMNAYSRSMEDLGYASEARMLRDWAFRNFVQPQVRAPNQSTAEALIDEVIDHRRDDD